MMICKPLAATVPGHGAIPPRHRCLQRRGDHTHRAAVLGRPGPALAKGKVWGRRARPGHAAHWTRPGTVRFTTPLGGGRPGKTIQGPLPGGDRDRVRRQEGSSVNTKTRGASYMFIAKVLDRTGYHGLRKKEKSTIKKLLQLTTGFSRAQLTRLIAQHRATGKIVDRRRGRRSRRARRL